MSRDGKLSRRAVLGYAGTLGAAGLAGSLIGSPRFARAQTEDTEASLLEQARGEGGLMFYSGMDEPTSRALVEGFSEKYGISAQLFRGGSQVTPKYQLELANNNVLVDVVQESNMPSFISMAENGQLESWTPPEAAHLQPGLSTPYYSVIGTIATTWMWNTRQVSEEQSPKAWEDFLKPEWKGRLGMPDLSTSSSGPPTQWYYIMRKLLGVDYMRSLGQQQFRFYQMFGDLSNAVASGEVAATPVMLHYYTLQLQQRGAPVAARFPDPAFVTDRPIGLAVNRPHPATGKLFLNYVLSPEGQTVMANNFSIPSRDDVVAPEGVPLPGTFNAVRVDDWAAMAAATEEMQAEFESFFKS